MQRSDPALPTREWVSNRWEAEGGSGEWCGAVTQTKACKTSGTPHPQKASATRPRSCCPVPHIAAGFGVSPGRAAEPLVGQQTCFPPRAGKPLASARSSVARQCREPVGDRPAFPGAGQRGTAPQTSRRFSCFILGKCKWALLPERHLKDRQPWADFPNGQPDHVLASRFEEFKNQNGRSGTLWIWWFDFFF